MNTKVAILGKLETKFKAPYNDNSWDIWGFNWHKIMPPRYTLWFDIHAHNPNPIANYNRDNFPFKELEDMVGGQYFNNTVSYLIGYAIYKGYEEIALYGVRFLRDYDEQRSRQKQSCREICMFARGRGVKVTAPADTCLLAGYPLYGV